MEIKYAEASACKAVYENEKKIDYHVSRWRVTNDDGETKEYIVYIVDVINDDEQKELAPKDKKAAASAEALRFRRTASGSLFSLKRKSFSSYIRVDPSDKYNILTDACTELTTPRGKPLSTKTYIDGYNENRFSNYKGQIKTTTKAWRVGGEAIELVELYLHDYFAKKATLKQKGMERSGSNESIFNLASRVAPIGSGSDDEQDDGAGAARAQPSLAVVPEEPEEASGDTGAGVAGIEEKPSEKKEIEVTPTSVKTKSKLPFCSKTTVIAIIAVAAALFVGLYQARARIAMAEQE
ncbi:MAG: hypothetical protein K1060chlam5_00240 [Candidatus Anoxychlamydiales bacterium]|nr:hypothetical protein [Candidatus Anoxychlamydiales bacterium]